MKLQPKLPADKLLKHLLKTTRCNICRKDYDREFPDCPFCEHCYSEVLEQRIYDQE